MPWLDLPVWVFALGFSGLAALLVGGLLVRALGRRQAGAELRRLTLGQLRLATTRNLPIDEALLALGNDLQEAANRKAAAPYGIRAAGWFAGLWFVKFKLRTAAQQLYDMASAAKEGALGPVLALAPHAFPAPWPVFLGEAQRQGTLGETLAALEEGEAEAERLRGEVRAQLYYPLAVMLVVQAPLWFTVLVIFPKLRELLTYAEASSGGRYEAMAAAQLWSAVAAPLLILLLWLVPGALGTQAGRVGRALRRLPGLRGTWRALGQARRARLLAAALRAGLPLPDALRLLSSGELEPEDAQVFSQAAGRAGEGQDLYALAGPLFGRSAVGLLPQGGQSPGALEAAAVESALEATGRVGRLARLNLVLGLGIVGALVATTYWAPFFAIQAIYATQNEGAPW